MAVIDGDGRGVTVRQLREYLDTLPDPDVDMDGEECTLWITTGRGLSSPVHIVTPLNARQHNGREWCDIIFETLDAPQ